MVYFAIREIILNPQVLLFSIEIHFSGIFTCTAIGLIGLLVCLEGARKSKFILKRTKKVDLLRLKN